MNTLGINLKHVYQKRGFLWGMVAFCLFAFVMDCSLMHERQGRAAVYYAPAMIWMMFFGSLVSALILEVLTKPFAFCMPGHNPVVRKFLFIAGAVLSALWAVKGLAVIMLKQSGFNVHMLVPCLGAFCLYTILYWCGVWLAMHAKGWTVSFAFFPLVMFLNHILFIFDIIEEVITGYGVLLVLAGIVVNCIAWNKLGDSSLLRKYCGGLRLGAFDEWNMDKIQRVRRERQVESAEKNKKKFQVSPEVEKYFMDKIMQYKPGSLGQYIWGGIYKVTGLTVSGYMNDTIRFIVVMVPMIGLFCYVPADAGRIVYLMPVLMFMNINLGIHSVGMPQPGRRERFWTALAIAVSCSVVGIVTLFLITSWTIPVARFMPVISLAGKDWAFTPMHIEYISLTVFLIPISLMFGLIFPNKPFWRLLATMIIFQFMFIGMFLMNFLEWNIVIGPLSVLVVTIVSWVLFVALLKRVCSRSNLVKNK